MEKVMLITGASGGMGSELTHYFLKKGFRLALHYYEHPVTIPETENCKMFKADLTKEEEVSSMMGAIIDYFGRLDIVINNAGISKSSMSWKTSSDDWYQTLNVNLTAPFFVSKYAIPHLRKNTEGRIIQISSVVAQTGFIGTAAYTASKAGLIGLTKTLSKELATFKITVNALALGYFNTGMIEDVPEELQEEIVKNIPLNSLGNPITVAKTIEWLISEEASYVTGQTINLNGGLYS